MNLETKLLNRLKAEQKEFALESLMQPGDKSSFEYGRRVGVVAGIEQAISALLNIIDEEKNSDNDL